MNKIVDFINVNRDRYVDELKQYLAIPEHQRAAASTRATCAAAPSGRADEMRRIGLQNVRLEETPGHPVVYGEWLGAPGAPTILFYGHYDVQPVDPLDLWKSPPFEATVRDGEIYARGAADDKGQVFMHFKAVEAHLKQTRPPAGQRQVPHRGRGGGRQRQPRRLHPRAQGPARGRRRRHLRLADVRPRHPVDLLRPARPRLLPDRPARQQADLHSGSFGGAVANPAMVLAQMLAQMKDKGGRIKIPGFYDDVRDAAATRSARSSRKLPFNEKKYRQGAGRAEAVRRDRLHDARARLGAADLRGQRPALGLHRRGRQDRAAGRGDGQGQHAPGAQPGSGEDRATSSRRTCKKVAPKTVELTVTRMHGGKPWMTALRQPVRAGRRPRHRAGLRPARRCSTARAARFRSSRPSRRSSALPCVLFGVGLPDENAHAPEREARPRQLPQRRDRVGVPVQEIGR